MTAPALELGSDDDAQWLLERIVEENTPRAGKDDWLRFTVIARDADGHRCGGVTGHTHWGWCYVGYLWVAPHRRRAGTGTQLLAAVETLARDRGCAHVWLDTFSFQDAVTFYEREGFSVSSVLDGYPTGHRRWTLCKALP